MRSGASGCHNEGLLVQCGPAPTAGPLCRCAKVRQSPTADGGVDQALLQGGDAVLQRGQALHLHA